jgi:UDP-N-acetylmuramyl pentapeptide phosphotransferase/UDP-N-acetylglucosamine-1-phosphate transferase
MENEMKDRLLLIVTGVVFAGLAWFFWHTTQQWGFLILIIIGYGGLLSDNIRLRRRIKELTKTK